MTRGRFKERETEVSTEGRSRQKVTRGNLKRYRKGKLKTKGEK